jgi:hypothetical protein
MWSAGLPYEDLQQTIRSSPTTHWLPSKLRNIACQNKCVVYDLPMKAAAETTLAIAAGPKRLGERIGITAVFHTWGSALI